MFFFRDCRQEMNDGCRICIEEGYTETINDLVAAVPLGFAGLSKALKDYMNATGDQSVQTLIDQCDDLVSTITPNDIEDFYFYYVARGVYASLGAQSYMDNFKLLDEAVAGCQLAAPLFGLICPETVNITLAEAEEALKRHADTTFSSITTAGSPFPLWANGNGTGSLFAGDSPVGGSGIDMSADIRSLGFYLALVQAGQLGFDPKSELFAEQVEKNPIFA